MSKPVDAQEVLRIRRLAADESQAFHALRLEGVRAHPDAFGASWQEEAALSLADVEDRLRQAMVFAASLHADDWAGIVGLALPEQDKVRHKAWLWGMYVPPRARGKGVAARLVRHVLQHARQQGRETVLLSVAAHNRRAQQLYSAAGFVAYGLEPRALRVDGHDYDEVLMRCEVFS